MISDRWLVSGRLGWGGSRRGRSEYSRLVRIRIQSSNLVKENGQKSIIKVEGTRSAKVMFEVMFEGLFEVMKVI